MTRRGALSRQSVAAAAACGLLALAAFALARATELDPSHISADAIKALQHRLTDAGCYTGAIDGAASAALNAAIKVCPDQRPVLRIETGMHTAEIKRIGVGIACRQLATASDDKTVRLWSLPEGKLQRVLRLPIGEGDSGKAFATATSPDGELLAVSRADGYAFGDGTKAALYLYDIGNAGDPSLLRRIEFGSRPNSFVFSQDGNRLAIGFKGMQGNGVVAGAQGVRVIDLRTEHELLADDDYQSDVYGLAFAPDGALITSSFDGQLRRYGPDLKRTVKRAAPDGKYPYGVAIDPSGARVAVGYYEGASVSILDAKTLAPLAKAQTSDLGNEGLSSVAWSRDGATLVAGGMAHARFDGKTRYFLRPFNRRKGADIAASNNTIMDIQPCGEGFAFAAFDPSFGLLSAQGVATEVQGPRSVDMRDKKGSAFAVSPDASSVRSGLGIGEEKPVVFDFADASLKDSPSLPSGFAVAQVDGLPVTDWENNYAPKFNGAKLALDYLEWSRALAIRSDASGFAIGTNWTVRTYDTKGQERWNRAGPSDAWGLNFSADGEILVVAYGDGTIRWLRWRDGEELLALFVEPQTLKWVAWTPTGYYMASAGGEDLIGWHVNRGWNQEADFFSASEFRAQYNRPDIVRLVLQTRDEAEAVKRANAASERTAAAKSVADALPPVVAITSPADGSHFSGESVEIAYALRSPSGLPIDRLDVLADGEPIPATGFEKTTSAEAQGRIAVGLSRKDTVVSLIAHSGDLTSAPVKVKLEYYGQSPAELLKPKLYALLVGVTGYKNTKYDTLQFPGRDAESLAEALDRQKGGLFADVQIKIVDVPTGDDLKAKITSPPNWDDPNSRFMGPPTHDNVTQGLYWLQRAATSRDLSFIFLSGHGVRDSKQNFRFLTQEANLAQLWNTAISNDALLDLVTSVAGKKVLFIDACHAGAALPVGIKSPETHPDMNKLVNDFTTINSGVVVYAASTGTEVSYEDVQWDRHGAFAKALIDAIGEGKASIDPSGRITTDMLDLYLADHVKELTKDEDEGVQHPVMNRPAPVPDFPLALAKP